MAGRLYQRQNLLVRKYGARGLLFVFIFSLLFILSCYHSLIWYHPEKPGCAMSYMYQSYAKLKSFDSKHTRLASRYSLYLYRDAKYDGVPNEDFKPDGTPVIFIPGNAGSYRQVRSIASLAAEIAANPENNHTRLDFYTMDFQEDFSAFHGRTLLDQAEYVNDAIKYILQLYDKDSPDIPHPKSVIIIGHSMGGFIARSLVVLNNYIPESINTIVTLATPHIIPPLTFDSEMTGIYNRVNQYWAHSFSDSNIDRNPLSSVALVSIGGGKNDNMIQSDYISLSPIAASSNSFATLSTSIPGVWTSIDHLAIVWCHQCRTALVNSLFEIVDLNSPSKTKPLDQRMRIFAKYLLSGLEPYQYNTQPYDISSAQPIIIRADENSVHLSPSSKHNYYSPSKRLYLTPISKKGPNLSASLAHIFSDPDDGLSYLLCSSLSKEVYKSKNLQYDLDLSDAVGGAKDKLYNCSNIDKKYSVSIPYSRHDINDPFESGYIPNVGLKSFRYYLFNTSTDFGDYDYLGVMTPDELSKDTHQPLIAVNSDFRSTDVEISASNFKIWLGGVKVRLRPLEYVDISLKSATSGLVSYRVKINSKRSCELSTSKSGQGFTFFMRQYVLEPFESKWHVNIGDSTPLYVSFHGVSSPYVPYDSSSSDGKGNLHLQVFSPMFKEDDTENCGPVTVEIQVDAWASLANYVIRYRTLLVPFSLSIVSAVMLFQFLNYLKTSEIVSFSTGLKFLVKSLPFFIIPGFVFIHFFLSYEFIRDLLHIFILYPFLFFTKSKTIDYLPPFKQNDTFIGESQLELWFVGPIAYITSIGFVTLVYYLVIYPISRLGQFFASLDKNSFTGNQEIKNEKKNSYSLIIFATISAASTIFIFPYTLPLFFSLIYTLYCYGKATYYIHKKENGSPGLPYRKEKSDSSNDHQLFSSHALSCLYLIESLTIFLLLSVVPVGIPIFIAWIHQGIENSFFSPFSSHHNIIYLVPMAMAIITIKKLICFIIEEIPIRSIKKPISNQNQSSSSALPNPFPSSSSTLLIYPGVLILTFTLVFTLIFGFLHSYSLQYFSFLYTIYLFLIVHFNSKNPANGKSEINENK